MGTELNLPPAAMRVLGGFQGVPGVPRGSWTLPNGLGGLVRADKPPFGKSGG